MYKRNHKNTTSVDNLNKFYNDGNKTVEVKEIKEEKEVKEVKEEKIE